MGVLWEDARKAFETYKRRFPGETLEHMAAGGGFGVEEFVYFYHGLIGPMDKEWPTDVCKWCQGDGSGLELPGEKVVRCEYCRGVGALLPKEHPGKSI